MANYTGIEAFYREFTRLFAGRATGRPEGQIIG
jgi:hypothetical protein